MRVTRRICFMLLLAAGLTACDRTPTDPALESGSDELWATGAQATVFASSPTSLSHLFRRAATRIEIEQGRQIQQRMIADWRRLNEEAQTALKAGDRETAQARIEGVRASEIRLVLRAYGNKGVERVVRDVGVGLARAQLELAAAEQSGADVKRIGTVAAQAKDLLNQANAALEKRDFAGALDHATRASDLLDGVSHFLISLHRIPALDMLFAEAVARADKRDEAAQQTLLARVELLNADARLALRNGDRETARKTLESVRAEQIRVVIRVLGRRVAQRLIERVDAGISATRARITTANDPRAAERTARMLKEAGNLNDRAWSAWTDADPAAALDLASHAAGLVNALQHLIPR